MYTAKENIKKKKKHTRTIQQWPDAYLLHWCCNNYYAEKNYWTYISDVHYANVE